MSSCEDLSSFSALSLESCDFPSDDQKVLNEDLGNSLTEFACIESKQDSACIFILAPENTQIADAEKGVESKDTHESESEKLGIDKCFSKCASFPMFAGSKCSGDVYDVVEGYKADLTTEESADNGLAQSANHQCPRSLSLPTPLKLVSAIKGSREKLGAPTRNLTVKWAPDVYDPLPTAVSHVPNKKPQRYRSDNKRNGKSKQKGGGKASRSKGKEKKQSRKSGGGSNKPFRCVDNESSEACSDGPQSGTLDFGVYSSYPFYADESSGACTGGPEAGIDFGVGTPDPFCGHSFLKKSVASLHFSVTEAT